MMDMLARPLERQHPGGVTVQVQLPGDGEGWGDAVRHAGNSRRARCAAAVWLL